MAKVREAVPDEVERVLGMYEWLFAPPGSMPPAWDEQRALEALAEALQDDRSAVFVAETDGEEARVGLCTAYLELNSVRFGRRCWVEEGRSGKMTFVVEETDTPRRLVTRIADPDLPFGGVWTYDITGVSGGSRLSITEDGEIYNPIFRFVARFIMGYEGTMRSYLEALDRKFALTGSGS